MSKKSVVPTAGAPILTRREITLVIVGLMAAMFLSSLNQTVVGTAMRTIADDLQGLDQQAWVTTAFLITSTVMTPIYGKLSDIFGRRPLFIVAIVIFLAGSALSGLSTSMYMLAAFRAVQGIGAGGLMALPLTVLADILAPRERAKYQGYFLAVFGVSSVIGPLIGGLFAGASSILGVAGWRWVFYVNIPVGIAALVLVSAFLHIPRHPRKVRIDWWGAVAITVGIVPLLLIAEQGTDWGWTSPGAWICYIVGALGILAFVLVERAMKDDALIPLKMFKHPSFSMATVLGVIVGFGMFGAMILMPLYLQIVLGASPTESGWMMIPMVGGLMVASIGSGQIIARTGRYKLFIVIGPLFLVAAFYLFTFQHYDTPYWYTVIGMVLVGLGLGQLMQPLTLVSQNSVDARDMGVATSAATFFRQMGGTLGVAVSISVLFNRVTDTITSAFGQTAFLTNALNAALDPTIASDPKNAAVMDKIWTPVTQGIVQGAEAQAAQQILAAQPGLDAATAQQLAQQQIEQALANPATRTAFVDQVVPTLQQQMGAGALGGGGLGSSLNSDTSFLNGADKALTAPFLDGFAVATQTVFWVSLGVMLLCFVLSFFLRAPALRQKSAAQEAADQHAEALAMEAQAAANEAGVVFEPPVLDDTADELEESVPARS